MHVLFNMIKDTELQKQLHINLNMLSLQNQAIQGV